MYDKSRSNRLTFKYGLRDLSHREEFLLQIILGVVNGKSDQAWIQDQEHPDILIASDVICELLEASSEDSFEETWRYKIALSDLQNHGVEIDPLIPTTNSRFDLIKIENALNYAGQYLLNLQQTPQPSQVEAESTYRLKRWPANYVKSASHYKVASLLLGVPMPLALIAEKSACKLDFCEAYINELRVAGFILESQPTKVRSKPADSAMFKLTPNNNTPSKSLSIFSKIRNRLAMPIFSR